MDLLESMLLDETAEPSALPLSVLKVITNDFSSDLEVGRGGSAVVYKGLLRNGTIAVKKLYPKPEVDEEKSRRELRSVMHARHKNIVRFLGYCFDTQWKMVALDGKHVFAEMRERLLCFDYHPKGNLERYITDAHSGLAWRKRYQILRGICDGLQYLHEQHIVHGDLKPGNVLLDNNMVPKLTDFGLSRFIDEMQTATTKVVGSLGYMAPEFYSGQISLKSDIYSLGVIIMEILTGQKGYYEVEHVLVGWKNRLETSKGDILEQVRACAEIGIKCLDPNPRERPGIQQIIEVLREEGSTDDSTQGSDEEFISGDTNSPPITDKKAEKTSQLSSMPKNLPLEFLQDITDDFSEVRKLGRGGFGEVYKGILGDGAAIAVRRLFSWHGVDRNHFQNEVRILMKLTHANIVNLLGYCHQDQKKVIEHNGRYVLAQIEERLLCYEYLVNGSIDQHIFGKELDWHLRYKIIHGISAGLHYLHKGQDGAPIIHLNMKPTNILLDEDMVPKITDFGLSRLFSEGQTGTRTQNVIGQSGYMAPEYINVGHISSKADIFSLGIIILEIVTGQENSTVVNFIEHVRENWMQRPQIISKYPSLDADSLCQVELCIEIGLDCVNTYHRMRPTIADIIRKFQTGNKIDLSVSHDNAIITEKFDLKVFSYKHLNTITESFSPHRLLGEGGYGFVYKGELGSDRMMAVKRLNKQQIGISKRQFENEVRHLGTIKHTNIVQLIGYCDEVREILSCGKDTNDPPVLEHVQERLLCYEFMPNGSLDDKIYQDILDWPTRYRIIEGICQGLSCLHDGEQSIQIVHLDLKPANILLDSNMVPKLADFGMSRLFSQEQVHIVASKPMGTIGYMAPEYLRRKEVSKKADMYSLGIIILEIVTREKCPCNYSDMMAREYVECLRQKWAKDHYIRSMYPYLEADSLQQVQLCMKIGFDCVDMEPTRRPSAWQIIRLLQEKRDSTSSGSTTSTFNVIESLISKLPWHILGIKSYSIGLS